MRFPVCTGSGLSNPSAVPTPPGAAGLITGFTGVGAAGAEAAAGLTGAPVGDITGLAAGDVGIAGCTDVAGCAGTAGCDAG